MYRHWFVITITQQEAKNRDNELFITTKLLLQRTIN